MSMNFLRKLPIPMEIKKEFPLTEKAAKIKAQRDSEIADVFSGKSDKLVLVIGPCSADREDAVLDYIERIAKVQEEVKDKIVIIPRIYTGKPRTTGEGYKGMLHQPDPDKKPDMLQGIIAIRALHAKAIDDYGMSCADEMLYVQNYRYLDDLLAYVAIGARSSENQEHRLVSSGITVPVGMKNPTGGDLGVMMNSIVAAQSSHMFIYRGWEVETTGNPLCHAILRGSVDRYGTAHQNYHYEDLQQLSDMYAARNLQNPAVIVDCNHSNSNKQYLEQVRICNEVLHATRHSGDIKKLVKGFMIESYIEDGCQKIGGGVYGKSITDPCLGWEKSRDLIYSIAEQI
ncbi:MAG: 3-deoxy-7-phosphoheptulonate synthase [Clostridia bacterium]|nr:3-deoxy-7-phosphoheptulonate synthase [Clostridia bacterium]